MSNSVLLQCIAIAEGFSAANWEMGYISSNHCLVLSGFRVTNRKENAPFYETHCLLGALCPWKSSLIMQRSWNMEVIVHWRSFLQFLFGRLGLGTLGMVWGFWILTGILSLCTWRQWSAVVNYDFIFSHQASSVGWNQLYLARTSVAVSMGDSTLVSQSVMNEVEVVLPCRSWYFEFVRDP